MKATDIDGQRRELSSLPIASGLLGMSTVVTRLAILVVMALLVRGAGTAATGYYGLATLSASFTAAALSLGFPTYLTRDVPAGLVSPAEVARIHWARFVVLLLAAGVSYPIAAELLPRGMSLGFTLYFGASLLEQWNETAWVLVRGTRVAWVEPLTNGCIGVLLVAACALDAWTRGGLRFQDTAVFFVIAAALRSAAACLVVGVGRPSGRGWRGDAGRRGIGLPTHVRRALPYFASDLLGLMYFRGDVFVLAFFVAAARVGEYVSAAAIVGPVVQVAASMGLGALAYAARHGMSGDRSEDRRKIFEFFGVSGQLAAGLICVGLPVAAAILFGGGGHAILDLSLILALFLAMRFANFGLSALLLARGRASSRLLVLVFSIAGNVALNLALDGPFGAYGAAWSTVLTELIVTGSLVWFLADRAVARAAVLKAAGMLVAAGALAVLLRVLPAGRAAPVVGALFLAMGAASFLAQRRGRAVLAGMEGA